MPKCLKDYANETRKNNYRNRQRKRNYTKSEINAINKNEKYTLEECDMILEHSIPDIELSKKIGRSVKAIHIKRAKLKQQ